ncbi:LOW QUALITY PROTEIN: Vegetative incompatibility protein [Paramyrothecium foliicola]|nr:LOW QUALITY PROTEIN: Vegetative incompatibility protein [Paramyrothecium foliicola]
MVLKDTLRAAQPKIPSMAEVLTAIEVALCVSEVVKTLYDYGNNVKNAKDDIHALVRELFALKEALEHLDSQSGSEMEDSVQSQVQGMLRMTQDTLDDLEGRLSKHKSRLGRAIGRLTWPFDSDEVQKHVEALERSKTWFIMVILKDTSDRTIMIYDEMKKLTSVIHEDILERQTSKMLQETEELLSWLAPSNAEENLALVSKNKVPGTGKWFLSGESADWLNAPKVDQPFIWITGKCETSSSLFKVQELTIEIAGAGKTILFSSIIDELQAICASTAASDSLLGYHCCSLDSAVTQPLSNIFGSVLAQIGRLRPEFLKHIEPYKRPSSSLIPQSDLTLEQISAILASILSSLGRLYILVDALNETPHQEQLVRALVSLCASHPQIRVLVTCTRGPSEDHVVIRECQMPTKDVGQDIKLYVNHRLSFEPSFRGLSPNIHAEIRRVVPRKADGMFRWAKLCMDRLAVLRTGRDVRDALTEMPTTLNDTYEGILARIADHDREIAREALLWLCFCLRPLTLTELAEAVVLRETDVYMDDDSRLTDPNTLLDVCQGLAACNKSIVTLAHDSVRSFLLSPQIRNTTAAFFALDAAKAHSRMMRKCLTYLQLAPFASGPVTNHDELESRIQLHPLVKYATFHWPVHSERQPLSAHDEDRILAFFATKKLSNGSSFESWVQLLLGTVGLRPLRSTEPLYYAASFNMVSILKLLLRPELKVDLDQPGGRFSSPPSIWRGSIEAAKLLLAAGANPDAFDSGSMMTSRQIAVDRRNIEIQECIEKYSPQPVRKKNASRLVVR